jgi:hypothetical protein
MYFLVWLVLSCCCLYLLMFNVALKSFMHCQAESLMENSVATVASHFLQLGFFIIGGFYHISSKISKRL